jgi:hypothetical protein
VEERICSWPVALVRTDNTQVLSDLGGGESLSSLGMAPQAVVVHPLVLLSVVDHYNRVAKV